MELSERVTFLLQELEQQAVVVKDKVEHGSKKEKDYYLGYLHGIQKALHDLREVRTDLLSKEIPF